ncbi:uncharacterized protein LOC112169625 isoform X2 [Rosa chinensis]|uniref:uncharacterized protein LOC112169625 isoform X2 n=1 Tax=Rosa chinensis TaxID=74649 RepID=UPI000D0875CD|nr:uncharacterized protein LOC112169625 isoform X2 [Rosa chinensis]
MEKVDPKLEVKIKEAKKLIAKMAQDKLQFTYTLEEKIFDQFSLESWLRYLNAQNDRLKYLLIKEMKKMDLLQMLVDKIRCTDNTYQKNSIKECLSAQEMNNHKLHCQMVHGSKSLRKEKQLLEDMKLSQQEDKFVSFWTQLEEQLGVYHADWRFDPMKQILLLHHQMPVLIITGDAVKDRIIEFRDLEWRIQSCGVALRNEYEAIAINNVNGKSAVKGKTWTPLGSKKALQEQVKVAGKKIDELRKTQLALGLGKIISQVERESEAMKRGIDSWRKKFPELNQRKDKLYLHYLKPIDEQPCSMRLETLSFYYY